MRSSGPFVSRRIVARFAFYMPSRQCDWLLIAVLVAGGAPLVIDLSRKLFTGEFGSDLLAGMFIATSGVLGEYFAGSIVMLMLSGGPPWNSMRRGGPRLPWQR